MSRSEPVRTPPPAPPPRWQPRFGLGAMLLLMLVCGVMSSAGYYLVRGNLASPGQASGGGHTPQLAFLLITLASPLLLVVIISAVLAILRAASRRQKPRS
ncbi:MAG: hypothetical protein KY475_01855 [Planctomycetes bacterium]|nr:hypothetical protein [Planctomycetota bacterium]